MTHDEPEIEQAWARLNELSEDLSAFALRWVALDRVAWSPPGRGQATSSRRWSARADGSTRCCSTSVHRG
jgi:hypothetical protein